MSDYPPAEGAAYQSNEKYTGATSLAEVPAEKWLRRQKDIVGRILVSIFDRAQREAQKEANVSPSHYQETMKYRRPSQVHLIDGPRGSGKTSVLLTVEQFLDHLCDGRPERAGSRVLENNLKEFLSDEALERYRTYMGIASPREDNPDIMRWHSAIRVGGRQRKVVECLRIIVPEEMETSESVLEGLLAQMHVKLTEMREAHRSDPGDAVTRIEKAIDDLVLVAKGWYFAREIGVQALANDSLSFDSFIKRRMDESRFTHRRIEHWRAFVADYLDLMGAELLVVLVDDSDTTPQLTAEIIDVLRVMLDHPRIVSIMAGNMASIRHSYVTHSFENLAKTYSVLPDNARLRGEWRDHVRLQNEEFFEKVLPRHTRHFIDTQDDDFDKVFGRPFLSVIENNIRPHVRKFIRLREEKMDGRYRDNKSDDDFLENVIGWWLLLLHYKQRLTPRVIRHLNFFDYQVQPDGQSPSVPTTIKEEENPRHARRLAVVLFSNPDNFSLTQRFRDYDNDVSNWLRRQDITTDWRGTRSIKLNTLEIFESAYSYHMLLFRLDLQIGLPYRRDRDVDFPLQMLPTPSGKPIWLREIWDNRERSSEHHVQGRKLADIGVINDAEKLNLQQELHALERALNSPIIPANCVYFKDLSALPDIAFEPLDPKKIAGPVWPEFPAAQARSIFGLPHTDFRMPYFQDVVLNIASFPLRPPMPTDEFMRDSLIPLKNLELRTENFEPNKEPPNSRIPKITRNFEDAEKKIFVFGYKEKNVDQNKVADAIEDMAFMNENFFVNARMVISLQMRRAQAIREGEDKKDNIRVARLFSPSNLYQTGFRKEFKFEQQLEPHYRFGAFVSGVVPRYHRLLNDTRRAWHALRIFEYEMLHLMAQERESYKSKDQDKWVSAFCATPTLRQARHDRSDTYKVVGIDEIEKRILPLPSLKESICHPIDKVLQNLKVVKEKLPKRKSSGRWQHHWMEIDYEKFVIVKDSEDREIHWTDKDDYWFGKRGGMKAGAILNNEPLPPEIISKFFLRFDKCSENLEGNCDHPSLSKLFDFNNPSETKSTLEKSNHKNWFQYESDFVWRNNDHGTGDVAREDEKGPDWQLLARLFFDWPQHHDPDEGNPTPEQRRARAAAKDKNLAITRQLRAEFLAAWGLGPTLCSLIHVDLMGAYYFYLGDKPELTTEECMDAFNRVRALAIRWRVYLVRAQWFAALVGHSVEWVASDNRFLRENGANSDGLLPPLTTLVPDQSLRTIGVRTHRPNEHGPKAVNPLSNRKFKGEIGDILVRYSLAEIYLNNLYRDIARTIEKEYNAAKKRQEETGANDTTGSK